MGVPLSTSPTGDAKASLAISLFSRQDPQRKGPQPMHPVFPFRERSRTHARAKPCLAGRPTMLVRTQPPETNTSRGRPSGMELPDYPVVATLPTPQDQDGPAPPLPARSFPGFVSRDASRRSFPRSVPRYASPQICGLVHLRGFLKAATPSSSSMRTSWLYFDKRSEFAREPILI
jgi:hypothetical protein